MASQLDAVQLTWKLVILCNSLFLPWVSASRITGIPGFKEGPAGRGEARQEKCPCLFGEESVS